jgi:uncharacterized membrane protein YebE (DUF533 family)
MTAKAKALQVLVAVSISAVAYTVYSNSSSKKASTNPGTKHNVDKIKQRQSKADQSCRREHSHVQR